MAEQHKQLGLIGKPLSHSFSKSYFEKKFSTLGIRNYKYDHFQLNTITELPALLHNTPNLVGLNVTIPYKKEIIPFLHEISVEAESIGAVNVIKIEGDKLLGFNSDYYGFKTSLLNWIPKNWQGRALVLGTGGASLAVTAVLNDCNISYINISRNAGPERLTYQQLATQGQQKTHKLWINTTPLGMEPNVDTSPDLNYDVLDKGYYLFDLIYNPEITRFMQLGLDRGASVKNGLEMLEQIMGNLDW
jgi:shikimate dehydrogenase